MGALEELLEGAVDATGSGVSLFGSGAGAGSIVIATVPRSFGHDDGTMLLVAAATVVVEAVVRWRGPARHPAAHTARTRIRRPDIFLKVARIRVGPNFQGPAP